MEGEKLGGHAYRALPTPRSPTGQSLVQLAADLQDAGMRTVTNAKVVLPGASPTFVFQRSQYLKPCASPEALTDSRRKVPGRKHTLLSAPTCQALCQVAVKLRHMPSTSTPGGWAGGIIPTWKQEGPALKSQGKERPPQFSALWLPHSGSNPSQRKNRPRPVPDTACPPSQGPRLKKPGVGGAATLQQSFPHAHTCVGREEVVVWPFPCVRGCPSVSWARTPFPHPSSYPETRSLWGYEKMNCLSASLPRGQ